MPDEFENLYQRIGNGLERLRCHAGPIVGRHRLMIYLRVVSQGMSFTTFAQDMGCGVSTVSQIVNEDMRHEAFPPITRRKLEQVARRTQARYDYPRAVGFMDGKHIRIKKPAKSGSTFYNYKNFHSIILLALCDCDYRIMAFDIGSPGRFGDAAAYQQSAIKTFLDDHDEIFPPTRELGSVGPVQYHILVNGGFGQSHRLVRPYRENEADTPDKRLFNNKLSGARRIVESTFGLLAQRFRILTTCINLDPERTSRIVVSLMILHNCLPLRQDSLAGVQRFQPAPDVYQPLLQDEESGGRRADSANVAKGRITEYYASR